MLEIDMAILKRLHELDAQMEPPRREAQEILERTRPGFRPYVFKTLGQIYLERTIGPEAFYAAQRVKAAATRKRNAEAKRVAEPKPTKPKRRSRSA